MENRKMPKLTTAARTKSVQEDDEAIGRRIRAKRLARDLSQTELANRIGVTFQQVQKYEKGVNRVSGARLIQIADLLGMSITELMGGDGRAAKGDDPFDRLGQTRDGHRLARAFIGIKNDDIRRAIVELTEAASG